MMTVTKESDQQVQEVQGILANFLHTVGCGLCKNENTKICRICVNYRSTHIFFDYKEEYLEEIATEIIQTIKNGGE